MKRALVGIFAGLLLVAAAIAGDNFNVLDKLNISFSTATITGQLGVANGGTGAATMTGIPVGSGTSAWTAYAGTSCTNQFPRSLSAAGVASCATVGSSDLASSLSLTTPTLGVASATSIAFGNEAMATYRQAVAWTPQLQFGGANVGMTFTTQAGVYSRVGNLVIATFNVVLSNKGSSTGAATITGLPVAVNGTSGATGLCSFGFYGTLATANTPAAYINTGASTINLGKLGGTAFGNLADTDFGAATQITGVCTYLS